METTTPDAGAQAQPEPAAVTSGHNPDQVITTDAQGSPTMVPATSVANEPAAEAPAEQPAPPEPQAQANDTEDLNKFATAKGYDPEKLSDGERKALDMARNAEKRMHEATEKARELETTAVGQVPVEYTGNTQVDTLAKSVNTLLIQNNVRDFFSNNPEARQYEPKMAEIVTARPHLQNDLDALYALARTDPSVEADIKAQGGKEALTALAQKQSQIPPGAGATNSGVYETSAITPGNVFDQIDKHDQAWFEANHEAISKAISGK